MYFNIITVQNVVAVSHTVCTQCHTCRRLEGAGPPWDGAWLTH